MRPATLYELPAGPLPYPKDGLSAGNTGQRAEDLGVVAHRLARGHFALDWAFSARLPRHWCHAAVRNCHGQ